MLAQSDADRLIATPKILIENSTIQFPKPGVEIQLPSRSSDGRDLFTFDANRKGKLKLTKCTFQERYAIIEILLRLDIDGPPHENPDGMIIPCPHLHIYREGFATKWASKLPSEFTNPADLVTTFRQFLKYANVTDIPSIQRGIE